MLHVIISDVSVGEESFHLERIKISQVTNAKIETVNLMRMENDEAFL